METKPTRPAGLTTPDADTTLQKPDQSGRPTGGGLVRITVNLTPRSAEALDSVSASTGLSKTDVINRSLQVYALVEQLMDRGGGSLLVKHPDGELERVYIL